MLKKTFAASVALALIIAAGAVCFLWKRPAALGDSKAAEFLPGDTAVFAEVVDVPRSKSRWLDTALHQIAQEPDVAAFLQKPMSMAPVDDRVQRFLKLEPKEVFAAVTGQGAQGPKVVAGFDFTGSRHDAEGLVADLKGKLVARYPEGKSDVQKYGSSQIETFSYSGKVAATVFKGAWFFASNDLDALKGVLDRVDGQGDAKNSLKENATYQLCLGKLPKDSDAVAYANAKAKGLMDGLQAMIEAAPDVDPSSADELKKIQAVAGAFKMDGENLRDALYVYKPGGTARTLLEFHSKEFTSPGTVFYFVTKPSMRSAPAIPQMPGLDATGSLAMVKTIGQILGNAGLGFDEFKKAFGPEAGVAISLDNHSPMGRWIMAVDVRDRATAQKFLDTLGGGLPKKEIDGVRYYEFPALGRGLVRIAPVLALTDKALLCGVDIDSVSDSVKGAAQAQPGGATVDQSEDFRAAGALVVKPTDSFGYIDSRQLFESIFGPHGLGRAFLVAAAFSPASKYADFGKVPPAEEISRHLKPMVYSQSTDENGSLTESVGPVTFTEFLCGLGMGGGVYGMTQERVGAFGFGR